jgi:hypothetical protein
MRFLQIGAQYIDGLYSCKILVCYIKIAIGYNMSRSAGTVDRYGALGLLVYSSAEACILTRC